MYEPSVTVIADGPAVVMRDLLYLCRTRAKFAAARRWADWHIHHLACAGSLISAQKCRGYPGKEISSWDLNVRPRAEETDVRFIDAPPAAHGAPMWPRRFAKEGEEALDPTVDGAAINRETAANHSTKPSPWYPVRHQRSCRLWWGQVAAYTQSVVAVSTAVA